MNKKYVILVFILIINHFLIEAQEIIPERLKFDWKEYYLNNIIVKDSISNEMLQGIWLAYEGCHVGEYKIGWKTKDQPKSLQVKGEKYRQILNGEFYSFRLNKNLIIFETDKQSDSAYINLITDKEFTITFKTNSDYEQYYYKKK